MLNKEYHTAFWNYLRQPNSATFNRLPRDARVPFTGGARMPEETIAKLQATRKAYNPLRQLATVVQLKDSHFNYFHHTPSLVSEWNEEGGRLIDMNTGSVDTTKQKIVPHHLSSLLRLSNELKAEPSFSLEDYLVLTFGKEFAKEETKVFINGDGLKTPKGLLHQAEVGHTSTTLSYEALLQLYVSVDVAYRSQATWIMSDTTALQLRTLTDKSGRPLWYEDTLLGQPVVIVNGMTNTELPIAFGDFSYFWIFDYHMPSVKVLEELYALKDQTGYLAYEQVESLLINRDAVKLLQVKG